MSGDGETVPATERSDDKPGCPACGSRNYGHSLTEGGDYQACHDCDHLWTDGLVRQIQHRLTQQGAGAWPSRRRGRLRCDRFVTPTDRCGAEAVCLVNESVYCEPCTGVAVACHAKPTTARRLTDHEHATRPDRDEGATDGR